MFNSSDELKDDRALDSIENSASFYLDSPDPVFIIDKQGEFIAANNAFCQAIGRSKEEILGINIGEASFLTESARKKAMYRNVLRLIEKETPVYTLDIIVKNGDVLSLEIDTKPHVKHEKAAGEISIVKKSKKHVEKDSINLSSLYKLTQDRSD